jgi:hypothetical protein
VPCGPVFSVNRSTNPQSPKIDASQCCNGDSPASLLALPAVVTIDCMDKKDHYGSVFSGMGGMKATKPPRSYWANQDSKPPFNRSRFTPSTQPHDGIELRRRVKNPKKVRTVRPLPEGRVRCVAITRTKRRCRRRAVAGTWVCDGHGGSAPQVRLKAERRWSTRNQALRIMMKPATKWSPADQRIVKRYKLDQLVIQRRLDRAVQRFGTSEDPAGQPLVTGRRQPGQIATAFGVVTCPKCARPYLGEHWDCCPGCSWPRP